MVRGYNVGGGDAMGGSRRSVAIVMLTSPFPVPSSRTRTGALEIQCRGIVEDDLCEDPRADAAVVALVQGYVADVDFDGERDKDWRRLLPSRWRRRFG